MNIAIYKPSVTGLKSDFIHATALTSKKEVVFTKYFRHPSFNISLRPFSVQQDMPAIYSWAWKLSRAANTVAASYLYTGHSDFARSFMAVANNRVPICQIDVCNAEKDELYELYPSAPGDYIIRMLMNTNKKIVRPLHVKALQTCVSYLFQFPEVNQIIADPETDNKLYNEILQKAGFQFETQLYNQYIMSNLFICNRQSFIPA